MYRKIVKSRERVARKLKKLTPLDIFYLMQKNITCTYFYKEMIDKDLLVRSVSELVKIYPFLYIQISFNVSRYKYENPYTCSKPYLKQFPIKAIVVSYYF